MAVGLLFLIAGLFLTLDASGLLGRPAFGLLGLSGPLLLAFGAAWLLFAIIPRRVLLVAGLGMVAVGIFPWAYTPWLMGTRGGDEGSGMLGTLIFIFVGLPGLAVTLACLLACLFDIGE